MGKVRDLVEEWQRSFREATRNGTYRSMAPGAAHSVDVAEKEDASAHAAELEAKDKQIAELEEKLSIVGDDNIQLELSISKDRVMHCQSIGAKNARIAELEAECARLVKLIGERDEASLDRVQRIRELEAELEAKTFRVSELTNDWNDRVRRNEELLSSLRHIGDIVGRASDSHETVANAVLLKVTSLQAANNLLKAELAKRKELPPLPESVREWAENVRSLVDKLPWLRDLIDWLDAHCPAPVPQWERDARLAESAATTFDPDECEVNPFSSANRPKTRGDELREMAARIREMGRELDHAKSK